MRALPHDPLLNPTNLDQPDQKAKLDALIQRVLSYPVLYAYYLRDEPSVPIIKVMERLLQSDEEQTTQSQSELDAVFDKLRE